MSILTDKQIMEGNFFKKPIDSLQLQKHAVDLRLGFTFTTFKSRMAVNEGWVQAVPGNDRQVFECEGGAMAFTIMPGEYVLGVTMDEVQLPNDVMAIVYPRSTTNRRGLSIDMTGIVDAGYHGQLTLPIRNNTLVPIAVLPGERIASLVFHKLIEAVEPRQSQYHNFDSADGYKLAKDEERQLLADGKIQELKTKFVLS